MTQRQAVKDERPRVKPKTAGKMFYLKQRNKVPPIADPLLLTPGHQLSKRIKDGSLTAAKLCAVYVERIRQVNPVINALAEERFEAALEAARRLDELLAAFRSSAAPDEEFSASQLEMLESPLLGVPVSVKESIMVKGMRNSCGLWSRRQQLAEQDAAVVKNIRRLGLIPVCTTNVPECTLYWADCHNSVYGRTLNPYDLSRITGASSGGEGALIGAGASLMGIGSDIGGSLRIPAHFCGINSHKPSPFLVSAQGNYPAINEGRLRLFTFGPMCRYASDLRPLLKCLLAGDEKPADCSERAFKYQPDNIGALRRQLIERLDEPVQLGALTIYYCNFNQSNLKLYHSVRVPEEFMRTQEELLEHFRSKFSCQTVEINLNRYMRKTMMAWQCLLTGAGAACRDEHYREHDLQKEFGVHNIFLEMLKLPLGASSHTKEALLALSVGNIVPQRRKQAYMVCEKYERIAGELKAKMEATLGDSGVLLMPTMPSRAYKHHVSLLKTPDLRFTALFNILQLPVSHAHAKLDAKLKLPYGFSVAAKPYQDHITLAVAEEIESALGGWSQPNLLAEKPLSDMTKNNEKSGGHIPAASDARLDAENRPPAQQLSQ